MLPFESTARLPTPTNSPGRRPPCPKLVRVLRVERCRMYTFLSQPFATYMNCCCPSFENVMSHADPPSAPPVVVLERNTSLTYLPSFWKTWMRFSVRSQTL